MKRFEDKIRELTDRSSGQSMSKIIENLNSYLMGWIGYFQLAQTRSVFEEFDQWIRRKLRVCLLKQWKKPQTKIRNLMTLGIPEELAVSIGSSGKGCWRLSRTQQLHKALGIAYWREQGLVSLVERYDELRASA